MNVEGAISDSKSSENIVSENTHKLGWKPEWSKSRFLQNIHDEIQAVLALGKAESSLIDSLFEHDRGWVSHLDLSNSGYAEKPIRKRKIKK